MRMPRCSSTEQAVSQMVRLGANKVGFRVSVLLIIMLGFLRAYCVRSVPQGGLVPKRSIPAVSQMKDPRVIEIICPNQLEQSMIET